jgi:hypothetical protein
MVLHLALDALLPLRAPDPRETTLEHGFRLRLPDGPALSDGDPLLTAFGAAVVALHAEDDEVLQADAFDPGRPVLLLPEPTNPREVAVWDAEGVKRAGTLTTDFEWAARAALEHGLDVKGLVLREERDLADDRRGALLLLVHGPQVAVAAPATPFVRPTRPRRPRLVLFADGTADVRWWDPTAAGGPLAAEDVPVSEELATQLAQLRRRFAQLPAEPEGPDAMVAGFERAQLHEEAADVWRRARAELGRRYAVGFLGPGMRRPVWSPGELEPDDDDMPF